MIVEIILSVILAGVLGVMNFLPTMQLFPQAFTDAWDWAGGYLSSMFWTIPSGGALLQIFSLVFIIEGGIFIFSSWNWVINKLRGSGG